MNRLSKKQDEGVLKNFTPAFGVISGKQDDKKSWIIAGQTYERIALEAVRIGMQTAPLAAAIQWGDFSQQLQQILNTNFRPPVFFRIGYPVKEAKPNPRLPALEVISIQ